MTDLFKLLLGILASRFKARATLEAENLVLRQQVNVLRRRTPKRPHLNNTDCFLFVWLYRWFPSVLEAVAIVRPETIIRWHRAGFRAYWRWRSRNHVGRPKVSAELRTLIGEISRANALWGAPRIHGELLKLGFEVAQSTVARVHVPPLAATASGLADLSQQSRRRHRGDRPPCPADDRLPDSVLSCHWAPWTTTLGVVWRDGKPNRGVDLAPSQKYRGGAFVGEHGSWDRPRKVVFVPFSGGLDVVTGFLNSDEKARGRPVELAVDKSGALQCGLACDTAGQ
jgi:hypothetical protein